MAETAQEGKLLTLTEVAQKTGISMPTLQRYKKLYQSRIPSHGKGRKQRYPEEALEVFDEIKKENISKRGRPKKSASAGTASRRKTGTRASKTVRKPRRGASSEKAQSAKADTSDLLTLTEISKVTGISYPTLSRYVKEHADKLRHEGVGRARRFYEDAIDVFKELRQKGGRKPGPKAGRRGGRPKSVATSGNDDLADRVKELEKQMKTLERRLSKQIRLVIPGR